MKRLMRGRIRALLLPISAGDAHAAGERLIEQLTERPEWSSFRRIAAFSSLPGEIDTAPLIERAWRDGIEIVLPRMIGRSGLEFALYRPEETLVTKNFGVREPGAEANTVSLRDLDCVIVPGLAFDRSGGRLGRGAGYYDRAFGIAAQENEVPANDKILFEASERVRPMLIGAGFAFQMVDDVPMSSFDVRMDAVVTERKWHDVKSSRAPS